MIFWGVIVSCGSQGEIVGLKVERRFGVTGVIGMEWARDEVHICDARGDRFAGNVRYDIVDRGASCNSSSVVRSYDFPHFPTLVF
jgi:hypothetical protein